MMRQITENDFRHPKFRDAKVEDYELREDGYPVRKDRWERGMRAIASRIADADLPGITVEFTSRSFEIEDVIEAVEALLQLQNNP